MARYSEHDTSKIYEAADLCDGGALHSIGFSVIAARPGGFRA